MAVLKKPVVLDRSEMLPNATFEDPVVLVVSASIPKAVFAEPMSFRIKAPVPPAVFDPLSLAVGLGGATAQAVLNACVKIHTANGSVNVLLLFMVVSLCCSQ